jgi:DNA-directed RNA polymerase specialized sigma24 family protein
MTEKRFNDLYLDSQFSQYMKATLQSIYKHNVLVFQDHAIDYDDLEQECWMTLYESCDDDKDKNYYYAAMKNAALYMLRSINKDIVFTDFEGAGI